MALSTTSSNSIRQIAFKAAGWALIAFFTFIVGGLVGGPRFYPYLEFVGLHVGDFRGVFIDCSKPSNRSHEFCKPSALRANRSPAKQTFRGIDKNAMPFTIHGQ